MALNINKLPVFKEPRQTKQEKERRSFVSQRHFQMDTDYRLSVLEMAELGREAVDGIVTDEDMVGSTDLLKIPISHAVIQQRLSTLIDNPSKAIYRAETTQKKRLDVLKQLNLHDKRVGNYAAVYQNFQSKAEREGLVIVRQGWHEKFREIDNKRVTVGDFFTEQTEVMLENFWWDPVANELRGQTGLVANDCILRELMTADDFSANIATNTIYKNVRKVKPLATDHIFSSFVFSPEWENKTIKPDDPINDVILWHYFSTNFWDEEEKRFRDIHLVFANGVEILKEDIPVPKIKGLPVLPFFKLVAIPTGGFGGLSIPAVIRHPERALQRMITMADTQAELAVSPVMFMSNNLMDALEDEDLYPGTRIGTALQGRQISDEIYTMDLKDITVGAQYIINKMLELIAIITGVDINAFFESPKQKAVSTERKREIQERLLRFSVITNEAHGFTDMEELRLYIMLENYPVKRNLYRIVDKKETSEEKFPSIPINGFQVRVVSGQENTPNGEQEFELVKSSNTLSFLSITPKSLIDAYNVNLYIEGATDASNEDVFKLNKQMDKISAMIQNPWVQQIVDPVKAGRQVLKALNVDENMWIREDIEISDSSLHGAEKEIQALVVSDVFPNIAIPIDENYDAKEYEEVFANLVSSEDFKAFTPTVQKKIIERGNFHIENSLNPYYKETIRAQEQAAQQQAGLEAQEAQGGGGSPAAAGEALQSLKVQPRRSDELNNLVDSKAGQLGKAGKGPTTNSKEQRK